MTLPWLPILIISLPRMQPVRCVGRSTISLPFGPRMAMWSLLMMPLMPAEPSPVCRSRWQSIAPGMSLRWSLSRSATCITFMSIVLTRGDGTGRCPILCVVVVWMRDCCRMPIHFARCVMSHTAALPSNSLGMWEYPRLSSAPPSMISMTLYINIIRWWPRLLGAVVAGGYVFLMTHSTSIP